jgi:hypothetical protein
MPETSAEALAELSPKDIRDWVESAWAGGLKCHPGFNWLGLAEVLAFDARARGSLEEKVQLAELAVKIYEWLAGREDNAHGDSYIDSAIAVRVFMLANKYVAPSHPVLGVSQITEYISGVADISPSQAMTESRDLKERLNSQAGLSSSAELGKLQKLRRMKNRLTLIKSLPSCGVPLGDFDIEEWLEIYNELP